MTSLVEIRTGNEEPLYNIGVVTRITGISMATLRAWERRYDFPEAKRTLGGHRLYSERDILRLRWVKQRIDEGMQTSQAIHSLHHQEQTGRPILTEESLIVGQPEFSEPFFRAEKSEKDNRTSYFSVAKDKILDALINKNTQGADEILAETLAVFSPEALILGLIQPVMHEIGSLWQQGKISVAREHLATNYLRQRLMMWMVSSPPPRLSSTILLACAPDEWHEGSLLILGTLLRRRLWPVIYLGQAVPLSDLAKFVRDAKPALVVIVAMTEETAVNLAQLPQWLPDFALDRRPTLGFGGLVFIENPEWQKKLPGVYLGDSFEDGVTTIEKLLKG